MTLTVELRRLGSSRSSLTTIPIVARIEQGSTHGTDLLVGQRITDVEQAKRTVTEALDRKFLAGVTVKWLDRTGDGEAVDRG